MFEEWPTRDGDLRDAFAIIAKHVDFNDGEPLGLVRVDVDDDTVINCEISDWVFELYDFFAAKYGREEGIVITQRIMSLCLMENETVH